MKDQQMKVEDLRASAEKEGLKKEDMVAMCLNKIQSLYDYLMNFLLFLESSTVFWFLNYSIFE